MQLDFPKQYLEMAGKTVLEHSVEALLQLDCLEKLTICVSADDERFQQLGLNDLRISQTLGGAERADSVLQGLRSLNGMAAHDDWVLVHDAARPCLNPQDLKKLVDALQADPVGGILAARARDTVKVAKDSSSEPRIESTMDRSQVWLAQTPQMFRFGLLHNALSDALVAEIPITDEASAMEFAGHSVKLIESDSPNAKVTSPKDRLLFEFLLTQE